VICSRTGMKPFLPTSWRRMSPLILNVSTRWNLVVRFGLRPPYPREKSPVPTEWRVGRAPEPVWTFCGGEETVQFQFKLAHSIRSSALFRTAQRTHCTSFIKTNRLKWRHHGLLYEPQRTRKCAVWRRVVHMFTTGLQAISEPHHLHAACDKNEIAVSSDSWC